MIAWDCEEFIRSTRINLNIVDNLFSRESNRSSFPKPFYDLFGVNEKQRICCSQVRLLFIYQLTHFDVRDEALILKKVAFDWLAIHLPEINIHL